MKFKTTKETKETKSFAFIRKHKTAFGFIAGILIIIFVVSFGIQHSEPVKTSGSAGNNPVVTTNKSPVTSKRETDTESKSSVTETDKNSVKSNIEADTWYVYEPLDLLKFQNCVIYNATAVGSKGIVVQYFSVCKECHMIESNGEGLPRAAVPGLNTPIQKMYHCSNCGETTVVRLEIIQ